MIIGTGATWCNRRNHINEDFFVVNNEKNLYIICDGVSRDRYPVRGRSSASDISKLFAETVEGNICQCQAVDDPGEILHESILVASREIAHYNDVHYPCADYLDNDFAATVGICIWIVDNVAYCIYIGDCMAYLYRHGTISAITENQTEKVAEFRRKNGFNRETSLCIRKNFRNNSNSPFGYGALTGEPSALDFLRQNRTALYPNDRIFLLTDGLVDFFTSGLVDYEDDAEKILEKSNGSQYRNCDDDKTIIKIISEQ